MGIGTGSEWVAPAGLCSAMNYQAHWKMAARQAAAPAQRVQLPLAPRLESRRLRAYLMFMLADAVLIVAGFALSAWIYNGQPFTIDSRLSMHLMVPFYWTIALALQAYGLAALSSPEFARRRTLAAMLGAATALVIVAFFTKFSTDFSRVSLALGFACSAGGVVALRRLARPLVRRYFGVTCINKLVIDDGGEALRVPHAHHIDAREHHLSPSLDDPHMLDRIGLYTMNMDRVIVSCPPERRALWALVFKSANVSGEIVDREVWELGVIGARRGHNFGSLVVSAGPLGMRSRAIKRAFDVAFALASLLALLPLLVVVAAAIKLEDGGPIFFVQPRTGRGNRFFPIYKFRSMRAERADHAGHRSASRDDDRITRIGRFIRGTSIDELPQLLNVLKGDMSVVGPRPHAIGSRAGDKLFWEVDQRYWLRHSLKPGLTGLAQIRGLRGATEQESDLADRLQADLEYLAGWTIWRDMGIVLSTIGVMVHKRAY